MVLEILCVETIIPQYLGVLETCLALRYWFFEAHGSESVNDVIYYGIFKRSCFTFSHKCVNAQEHTVYLSNELLRQLIILL